MADAPAILSAHVISELRKLAGRAKVTHPYNHTGYPRIERVLKVPVSSWELPYDTPDEQYPGALLKLQLNLGGDDHNVEVYRRYDTLPGLPLITVGQNALNAIPAKFLTGLTLTTTVTDVAAGSSPDSLSSSVLSSQVQNADALLAQKTTVSKSGSYSAFTGSTVVDGRVATVTEAIVPDGSALPSFTTATFDFDRTTLGNGESEQRHVTVPVLNPRITFKKVQGGIVKVTESIVAPGTLPAAGGLTTISDEVRPESDWRSRRVITEVVDSNGSALAFIPPQTTVNRGSVGVIPGKFRVALDLTTTVRDVAIGTPPDTLSSSVLESQVQTTDALLAKKSTVTKSGSYDTFTGKVIVDGRLANVVESIASDGSALPTFTTATFDFDRTTLGNGDSQQRHVTVGALNDRVSYRWVKGGLEKTTEKIVDPVTKPTGGAMVLRDEVRARTDWQSERITTERVQSNGTAASSFPIIQREFRDPETNAKLIEYSQWQTDSTATLDSLGRTIDVEYPSGSGRYIVKAELQDSDESDKKLLIFTTSNVPADHVTYPSRSFSFPGVFKFLTGWSPTAGSYQPPFPGVNFSYKPPRTLTRQCKAFHSYHRGPFTDTPPDVYRVEGAGAASKIFGRYIGSNTVHDGFAVLEGAVTVESIPASTPNSYSATTAIVIDTEEKPWMGNIFHRTIYKMVESGNPHNIT